MKCNYYSPKGKLYVCNKLGQRYAKAGPRTWPTREQFQNRPAATRYDYYKTDSNCVLSVYTYIIDTT
jgi:hypothetical protein